MRPVTPSRSDADNDWPKSDYERGFSITPKQSRERYSEQPSLKRLMRDLQRPAARDDATKLLLARIDDAVLRGWIIEQIQDDRINRLTVYVRSGLNDATIIASWQAELNAEKTATNEVINDALQTQLGPQF